MWIIPTKNDVLAALGADELDMLAAKSVAEGQDVTQQQMDNARRRVLASVRRSGVPMGPAGTMPEEALDAWANLVASAAFDRLNIELKKSRRDARTEANAWLERVAKNEVQIVPYGADEQIAGGQSPKINRRLRTFGRFQEEGI